MSKTPAQIGDIIEVRTPVGLAYMQYTHDREGMGSLVRVLSGLFITRPLDFAQLAQTKELYFVFYALGYAVRDGQVEVVSHQPIPEWARPFPLMRWTPGPDREGKIKAWKIFRASDPLTPDVHRRTPVIHSLTPEQERLSVLQVWAHPVMVRKLARGWTPERDEELRLKAKAEASPQERRREGPQPTATGATRYYLYFPSKVSADKAGKHLTEQGFSVAIRLGADKQNWLVLVTAALTRDEGFMGQVPDEMQALAEELGGEYDGSELDASRENSGLGKTDMIQ